LPFLKLQVLIIARLTPPNRTPIFAAGVLIICNFAHFILLAIKRLSNLIFVTLGTLACCLSYRQWLVFNRIVWLVKFLYCFWLVVYKIRALCGAIGLAFQEDASLDLLMRFALAPQ